MRGLVVFASLMVALGCGKGEDKAGDDTASTKAGDPPAAIAELDDKAGKALAKRDPFAVSVKSARIELAYTGLEEGTVTVWIDDHGKTVILDKKMTKPMPQVARTIWKDGKTTMWNDESKRVQIMRLRPRDTELRLVSTNDPKQLAMAGYEKKPSEVVAGQDCEVWSHPKLNVTIWRWNNEIDLKYINGSVDKIKQQVEATAVETDVTLPADLTTYPEGYEVKDMTRGK